MNLEHWALVTFWILYCVLHSFLADAIVKEQIEIFLGDKFRYYRLAYSVFASVMLVGILSYQLSITSSLLFLNTYIHLGVSFFFLIPGIIIMIICIKKYFYELSGIQALQKKEPHVTLQQKGLHKHIRHPLYLGTLLFVWGLFLMFPLLSNTVACIVITAYVLIGIQLEEKKLIIEFGEDYRRYKKTVPMLVPDFNKSSGKK